MAKAKTGGLGRGLDFLFSETGLDAEPVSIINPQTAEETPAAPEAEEKQPVAAGENVVYLSIDDIKPNSKQPRKTFNEDALADLASSIREYGVIQPILVRKANVGYELVAGERRWRAARKAELKQIPAIIRELDERLNSFYALIENMQREDLNTIEEAEGLQQMMDDYGLTQEEAAKAVGKSRPYISNALRLLRLPQSIQSLVISGDLSSGHARALAGLEGEKLQLEAAEKAVKEGWSVRKIESYTGSKSPAARKRSKKRSRKSADIAAVEQQLCEALGTKVRIKGSEKKGKLEIDYYSTDELERIIELLQGEE